MNVEVCYASEKGQVLIEVELPLGSTVINAILASGILDLYPKLDLADQVGIFSKKVPLATFLREGDRVEIYRNLLLTPNQQRLSRVRNGR
jgi:putative ubiquitin-RnfH superfamily antitoxin RatB of RatAB toxin-antitoxin module